MNKNIIFTDNGIHQDFDFPNPIITYICKNPLPLPSILYKIYSTCKYFYPKIQVIPCERMDIMYFRPMMDIHPNIIWSSTEMISLPKAEIYSLNFKLLCLKTIFHITVKRKEDPKLIPFLFEKVFWHCSDCHFIICGQRFTFKEYQKLAAISVSLLMLDVGIVNTDDETIVPVDELLSIGINVHDFAFKPSDDNTNCYTPETAQTLAKQIRPKKICSFELQNLPADFNANAFSTFVKNNANYSRGTYITLKFHETVEEEVLDRFCDIINTEFYANERYRKITFKIGY